MINMSKTFITVGVLLIIVGFFLKYIGKLPGDILIKKGNTTFFFPIVTSIIISIVLSAILYIINKF